MNVPTKDFIEKIHENSDGIHLRLFDDKKREDRPAKEFCFPVAEFNDYVDELNRYNKDGYGVFLVINSGGTRDKDITVITAQFMENDDLSFEEQRKNIDAFKLPPSLIVQTRKSLHTYWLVKDGKVENFRHIQKQLIKQFKSDKTLVNESRVMRLPGFYHNKNDPVMVECIYFHPENRYTQEELSEALPEVDEETQSKKKAHPSGDQMGVHFVVDRCEFIQHCRDDAETLPEHDWYAMITNLAPFSGGTNLVHEFSEKYPTYSERETDSKIKHFLESKTGPMTCKEICDKGFECPLLGECPCEAPAGLAFKPLDSADLKDVLQKYPVSDDPCSNANSAREFIHEYLFNVDTVIADVFVNEILKEHFKLKASATRLLMKDYEKARHEFLKNYTIEIDNAKALPAWYKSDDGSIIFYPGILADYMSKNVSAFSFNEEIYFYKDGVYSEIERERAMNEVRKLMIPEITRFSQITDTYHQWSMQVVRNMRDVNANPYMINCRNGLYDVISDVLSPHTEKYVSTIQINAKYTPDAKCPRFEKFLKETFDNDQITLVQEIMGYCLVPVASAQKAFILVGEGRAGKSLLLRVITDVLLGRSNTSSVPWQALNERFKTAELHNKLANVCADLPSKPVDDNGIFKALIGEDLISAERKGKNPFTFQSFAKILFSCNSIPRNLGDKSNGFYRRLIILRFDHAVPVDKVDPDLLEKFQKEGDGIFLFAIEGLRRLINQGFHFSETESSKAEVENYKIESNSVLAFVNERCEVDPEATASRIHIYDVYKEYCKEGLYHPVSQVVFNKELENNFRLAREKDPINRRCLYKGIRIKDDE